MKKLIALLMILCLTMTFSFNCYAWALRGPRYEAENGMTQGENDIFFEDFTSYEEGGKPTTMVVKSDAENPIEIEATDTPDAKGKNVLKMTDTTSSNSVTLSVPETQGPITFEMRIKFKPTTTPGYGFIMDFKGGGANAFRIIKFSAANDSLCYVNSSGNNLFSRGADYNNQWFTIKVRIDNSLKQTGVILENENFGDANLDIAKATNVWHDKANKRVMAYSQLWYNEFTAPRVDQIVLQTYGSATSGEYFIDYIKMTENVPEFAPVKERKDGTIPTYMSDPVIRLVPGRINLIYKDDIKYFANPIKTVNGRAIVDAKSFATWYGLSLLENEGVYEMTGDMGTISFKLNEYSYTFNGTSVSTDTAPVKLDGCIYIPVKSFANTLGDEVLWQDAPQCVIIK